MYSIILGYYVGSQNGSDVQFVIAPACADFSLSSPADYCEDKANLVTVCFFTPGGANQDGDVIVSVVDQSTAGSNSTTDAAAYSEPTIHPINVPYNDVGAVWGLAYKKNTKQIFASSYSKVDSDTTPGNSLGTIYVVDNSTNDGTNANVNSASSFIDLNSTAYFNGAFGSIVAGTDSLAVVTRFTERIKKAWAI